MKKTLITLFASFLMISQICYGQDDVIDSLKLILAKSEPDTNRVNILISLCRYESRALPNDAVLHGNEARELSEKLNYHEGLANAYKYIGMGYYFLGNYWETINYWNQARYHSADVLAGR